MAEPFIRRARRVFSFRLSFCAALALLLSACAATPPPSATGPRPEGPPYPVVMAESDERRQTTLAAWEKLAGEQGIERVPAPELQPVTASIRSLPSLTTALYLPKIGDSNSSRSKQTWEDATTEALRRFIDSNARLFGAEAQQLSLVLLTDAADGTKKAKYQQRPFRYQLRNGFGELEITFTADRRILQITSTCIPEIEQLQRAGTSIRPRYSADEAVQRMMGRTFTYTDAAGNPQSHTTQPGDTIILRELVVYPILQPGPTPALEFHLAWEVMLARLPAQAVYLDAITDEIIAVAPR
ncbi:MAG TPA: hypothetical protein VF528_09470 [Pyrinomonadaceae bacterium]|jgi:hypothetical protein